MFLTVILLMASTVVAPGSPSKVEPFRHVPRATIPTSLGLYFCGEKVRELDRDCLKSFHGTAEVWKARVSNSGVDAWLVFPGSYFAGSGGPNFALVRQQGRSWVQLLDLCTEDMDGNCETFWQTIRLRTEVLPIVRGSYHDLRIEVDHCVKWNGKSYVNYLPEDYHQLLPTWFDASNPNEAEIFWTIRYAGSDHIQLEPQWFPIPFGEIVSVEDWKRAEEAGRPVRFPRHWRPLGEIPLWPDTVLDDSELGIQWVGLVRGGTWGIRGRQGFLLHPRRAYLGSRQFQISGDWLYVYEGMGEEIKPEDAIVRYNRHTFRLDLLGGNQGSEQ